MITEKSNTLDAKKLISLWEFCIKANINWLQYEILFISVNSTIDLDTINALRMLITIGTENDIHNGVPRIGQGNKIVGIADYIEKDFNSLLSEDNTLKDIVRHCLMGNYHTALEILNDIKF